MGSLEVHAERDTGSSFEYVGVRLGSKDYSLFGVLGTPGFKKYAVSDDGRSLNRLKSIGELPNNACIQIEERASELLANDQISARWIWFDKLNAPWWDDVSNLMYVHGPLDHRRFRTEGQICTLSPYDDRKRSYLESLGFRLVSPEEMDALIASNPAVLQDDSQATGKVYTLVESSSLTLAERLDFAKTLSWLRGEARDGRPLRVVFFIEA